MTAFNLFTSIVNVSNIMKELGTAGMRIEVGGDFVAYRQMRQSQTDRSALFPMFDTASSFVDDSNAFYVCGFDESQDLVHTQAIRMMDLGEQTLAQHMDVHRHKYITPGSTPDPDCTFYTPLNSMSRIKGRVCYHGEFWLKGGEGGHRSQGFTALLSRVVYEIALRIWQPDYVFGLVPYPLAMKGIPARYGYSRCEQGAWVGPNGELTSEEMLVWMGRSDVEQLLRTAPRTLTAQRHLPRPTERIGSMSAVA